MRLNRWHLAMLGAVGFLAIVPLLHISGPNYHHPIAVRVVHHARHVTPAPYNPYAGITAPTAQPSPAASSPSKSQQRFISHLARHLYPHGYGWRWHPWRRWNPVPWWLR